MTSFVPLSLKTFAVESRTIVAGSGPQSNVMTPPFATAATNESPVQLAAVPVPTTVVGADTSSASASAGMSAWPSGQPAGGPSCGFVGVPPDVSPPSSAELQAVTLPSATSAAVRMAERVGPISPRYRAVRSRDSGADRPRCVHDSHQREWRRPRCAATDWDRSAGVGDSRR